LVLTITTLQPTLTTTTLDTHIQTTATPTLANIATHTTPTQAIMTTLATPMGITITTTVLTMTAMTMDQPVIVPLTRHILSWIGSENSGHGLL